MFHLFTIYVLMPLLLYTSLISLPKFILNFLFVTGVNASLVSLSGSYWCIKCYCFIYADFVFFNFIEFTHQF